MKNSSASGARTFYILAATQSFSLVGSAMTSFAIGVWLFTTTGDTTPLLLVAFFNWLPQMFLGALAGAIADRASRKALIIAGDAGQAGVTTWLMLSFFGGGLQLWQLYAAALVG